MADLINNKQMKKQKKFLEQFLANERGLRIYISSVVRDPDLRDEIFQEVSMVLWDKFEKFDETRSFGAWARGIAANKMKEHWRKLKKRPVLLTPDVLEALFHAYNDIEHEIDYREQALKYCVNQLSDPAQSLVRLKYESLLSIREIADRVQRTVAATQKALSRIRMKLQDCVEGRILQEQQAG